MKKVITFIILLIVTKASLAQVPQLMNYQAVARNAQGQAIANQTIKVRLTLQQGTGLPIAFYSETRSVTTNALGLFNVQVGSAGAQATSGSINGTNWLESTQPRFLKVEIDVNNSGSFVDMGSQQLVSVPYALAAKDAETAKKVVGPFIGFQAKRGSNFTVPAVNTFTVVFDSEVYDSTSVYNNATGEFTAPEDGMYFLNYKMAFYVQGAPSGGSDALGNYFWSSTRGSLHFNSAGDYQSLYAGMNAVSNTLVTYLSKNEKVSVRIAVNDKSTTWLIHDSESTFQAYKIK